MAIYRIFEELPKKFLNRTSLKIKNCYYFQMGYTDILFNSNVFHKSVEAVIIVETVFDKKINFCTRA